MVSWAHVAFWWGCFYLAIGLGARIDAERQAKKELEAIGETVTAVIGTPVVPITNLIWRVVALTDDGHYYEVYKTPFDRGPGERIKLNRHVELEPFVKDDPDYQRLKWFTGGFTRLDLLDDRVVVVSDLRMGTVRDLMFRFDLYMLGGKDLWYKLVPRNRERVRRTTRLVEDTGRLLKREFSYDSKLPLEDWHDPKHYPEATVTDVSSMKKAPR